MSFRSIVADKIRAVTPDGITVYEDGQDVIATPCIIVRIGNPYQTPTSMAGDPDSQTMSVFLDVWIVSNRAEITYALDQIEEMAQYAKRGVMDSATPPVGRWTQLGNFRGVEIAGIQYAAAVLQTMIVSQVLPG